MSCGYFFILLIIYLHIMACLFFTVCLGTYKSSTDRLKTLDDMQLRYDCEDEPGSTNEARSGQKCYMFDFLREQSEECEKDLIEKFGFNDASQIDYVYGGRVHAWVPAYDNFDGSEKFWRHYELSLLDEDQRK